MLWVTICFLVILKIPAVYLGYVIWWAVKDPPEPGTVRPTTARFRRGGRRRPCLAPAVGKALGARRRPGPHGSPERRPRPAFAPSRAEKL